MVHRGRTATGDAGIPPAAHQDGHPRVTPFAPNESVVGADAAAQLSALRANSSAVTAAHPDHVFRAVPDRLTAWQAAGVDTAIFRSGLYAARCRYAELGLSRLLPLDRVLVGAESARPEAFGGFHHPGQGYLHVQMFSVVTMYGPLGRAVPERPELALLDLLHAYPRLS